jgi:hypothetical protein
MEDRPRHDDETGAALLRGPRADQTPRLPATSSGGEGRRLSEFSGVLAD